MRRAIVLLICLVMLFPVGCSKPETEMSPVAPIELGIARHPEPYNFARTLTPGRALPKWDNGETTSVDVRSLDLSGLDLKSAYDLLDSNFDSLTRWPAVLPDEFRPEVMMELGKDPGLNVRSLHSRGITGSGVSIAIIDQVLLVDHVEYVDRVRHYEEMDIHGGEWASAEMHGAAVASIAVGKTVGVAPGADLYYIGHSFVDGDFSHLAACVDKVVAINGSLDAKHKIRVLAIQIGWGPESLGAKEIGAAVARARKAGIFVITSSLQQYARLRFHGLGRNPLASPNEIGSYQPGGFYAVSYADPKYTFFRPGSHLLVPMDSRCVASPTGVSDYVFYRYGGWSWCTPYLAGLYALACQVKPDVTPEEFWKVGLQTGDETTVKTGVGSERYLGMIVNPVKLIDRLSGTK